VTGGARGLGFAAARGLLEHGASGVVIFDLSDVIAENSNKLALQALRVEFPAAKILTQVVDVCDEEAVKEFIRLSVNQLGSIDILLTFAGIATGGGATIDVPMHQWKRVLDVNLTGTLLCARTAAKYGFTSPCLQNTYIYDKTDDGSGKWRLHRFDVVLGGEPGAVPVPHRRI